MAVTGLKESKCELAHPRMATAFPHCTATESLWRRYLVEFILPDSLASQPTKALKNEGQYPPDWKTQSPYITSHATFYSQEYSPKVELQHLVAYHYSPVGGHMGKLRHPSGNCKTPSLPAG